MRLCVKRFFYVIAPSKKKKMADSKKTIFTVPKSKISRLIVPQHRLSPQSHLFQFFL